MLGIPPSKDARRNHPARALLQAKLTLGDGASARLGRIFKKILDGEFRRIGGVCVDDKEFGVRREQRDTISDKRRHVLVEFPNLSTGGVAERGWVHHDSLILHAAFYFVLYELRSILEHPSN